MAKVIFETAATCINLPVINFQFDETHLTEITKEVNEVLGKEKLALHYIPFNKVLTKVIAKYAGLSEASCINEVSQALCIECKTQCNLMLPY